MPEAVVGEMRGARGPALGRKAMQKDTHCTVSSVSAPCFLVG